MTDSSTSNTQANQLVTQTTFTSLGLSPVLVKQLEKQGIKTATPIQEQTLPQTLAGHNIAGQAQTGTGKTLAFLLATIQRLISVEAQPADPNIKQASQPRALVVAPTRELANQIAKDAQPLADAAGLKTAVCYGGTGYHAQRENIAAGVDILIGTPGRLIDYYKQHVFTLKKIEVVVLDEADRMFDLGFISDIRYLLRKMPKSDQRQSLLFSATLSHRVLELAYEHMGQPKLIKTSTQSVNTQAINQTLYHVGLDEKPALLVGLLQQLNPSRALVFINTKREASKVERILNTNHFKAAVLSGDVSQNKRLRLLEQFKDGQLPILVATDVAARGLHIPDVSHVFNYDLPQDPEDYIHRIGRTARAGNTGYAISLACENYVLSLPDIEQSIGYKINAVVPATSDFADPLIQPPKPQRRRRRRPARKHRQNHS